MKKVLIFLTILLISPSIFSNSSKGPLIGKNYYVPFVPYYSFPGESAAPGKQFDLSFSFSQYYIQDIVSEFHKIGDDLIKERFIDYEGYIFEPTVSFQLFDSLEAGLTMRLHAYYGGIFDSVFEGFHDLFNFPNGGREEYEKNEVYINIHTTSGIDLSMTEDTFGFGDLDLYAKWSFLSRDFLNLALFPALKIPTGSMEKITGSGYADVAIALLADFYIFNWLSFYLQGGIILPGQIFLEDTESPEPVFHLMASLELIISPKFSLLTQFRFNTSPIKEGVTEPEFISYSVKLHKPMTNIMAGVVLDLSGVRFQFYFEEDTFTNSGADLIVNLTLGKSFSIIK